MIFYGALILILLVFSYYEFFHKPSFVIDQRDVYKWPKQYPPNIACPKSDLATCIYSNESVARSECLKSPNCLGYWTKNAAWINKPGTAYQLVDTLKAENILEEEKNPKSLAKFYKRYNI